MPKQCQTKLSKRKNLNKILSLITKYPKCPDFFKSFFFIRSLETHRERGRDTGRGRSTSMQGGQRGTWSQVSRIIPGLKAGTKPLSYPGIPAKCPDFNWKSLISSTQQNLSKNKKDNKYSNTEMTEMRESSDKNLEACIIKIIQKPITNTPESNEKP